MIIDNINDCEGDVAFMFSLYRNNSYQSTVDYDVHQVHDDDSPVDPMHVGGRLGDVVDELEQPE